MMQNSDIPALISNLKQAASKEREGWNHLQLWNQYESASKPTIRVASAPNPIAIHIARMDWKEHRHQGFELLVGLTLLRRYSNQGYRKALEDAVIIRDTLERAGIAYRVIIEPQTIREPRAVARGQENQTNFPG